MEVIDENFCFLSNYEVYQLLKIGPVECTLTSGRKEMTAKNVATVHYEAAKNMERTACTKYGHQDVEAFLDAAKDVQLTKLEKLQILNLRPTVAVDLFPIVEELEARFDDEAMDGILDLIERTLPG